MGRSRDGSPVTGLVVRLIIVTLALLALTGCGSPRTPSAPATEAPRAQSAEDYVRIYGGLLGAYKAVLEETDCATLQEEFYTATENQTPGFQAAIDDRAHDLGCPTLRFTRP